MKNENSEVLYDVVGETYLSDGLWVPETIFTGTYKDAEEVYFSRSSEYRNMSMDISCHTIIKKDKSMSKRIKAANMYNEMMENWDGERTSCNAAGHIARFLDYPYNLEIQHNEYLGAKPDIPEDYIKAAEYLRKIAGWLEESE